MSSIPQVVDPISGSPQRPNEWRGVPAPHPYGTLTRRPQASPMETALSPVPPGRPLQTDVSSRFGRRLRELRRDRELTQAAMAKKFGIDRSFISDVERGRKSISLPMLEVIALGLQVSLSDLFHDL